MIYKYNTCGDPSEDKNVRWVDILGCIIAEQDNMMIGDPLDGLNDQIQEQIKNDGPFDVMIILKERQDNG